MEAIKQEVEARKAKLTTLTKQEIKEIQDKKAKIIKSKQIVRK